MTAAVQAITTKRCAVYCRVSSDERLDQSFNSIDAQREAGAAFISSQRSEGWVPVIDDYEDPGFFWREYGPSRPQAPAARYSDRSH